jgi:sulfatase maturation enzyme AslB (radical SAM superfamily)
MITNGTIDKLDQLIQPNSINLIVSLDGLKTLHDANRGEGNYQLSTDFLRKAHKLGFNCEVFSIIHQQNLQHLDEFEAGLNQELGFSPPITYHPRKPPQYLSSHPIANIMGETAGFEFLTRAQMLEVMKTRQVFPPKELGCYQIAVASDGKVYGCCEGTLALGHMTEPVTSLVAQLKARVEAWSTDNHWAGCLGCSQPDFMCGIKTYLQELYAN